ncbi:outer membrane beta-barrel protein [Aquirufa ecclesiirivi]|uniref:outer membrane beta-barrel protein n=1 Tax=Aquirufa ecclesiirivi TaxID=2715124 RepID=UPI003BAEBE0C
MKKLVLFLSISFGIFGQEDSLSQKSLQLSAYAEGYYLLDPADKLAHERDPFFYNHGRANQLDLNLGILGLSWTKGPLSAQISGMIGTYARRNLANEPSFWKNVFELNVSYRLHPEWTIIAGVFPSHIGFESAKNSQNWTLSRSLVAEYSPYYESGLSLYFKPNTAWTFGLFGLRGWQHIQEFRPALGTQIQFISSKSWTWNSSGFIGNEGNGLRLFHDFYLVIPLSNKIKTVLISDLGYQNEFWHGEALMVQAQLGGHWKLTSRWEQFSDPKAISMAQATYVQSASLGADYKLFPKVLLRSEWKMHLATRLAGEIQPVVHSPEYVFGIILGN